MRILVIRIGAFGDALITTPLIRYMKKQGHEIYYLGSEQAQQVLENNPNVDKFIYHKRDSVKQEDLQEYFDGIQKENECAKQINLCESVEVSLALIPDYPQWNWSKAERRKLCDVNYYEYAFTHAGEGEKIGIPETIFFKNFIPKAEQKEEFFRPEMFFTEEEESWALEQRQKLLGKTVIMWGLSGSARQKVYASVPYVVSDLLREDKDLHFILVGGETCQILEAGFPKHARIWRRSGDWTFRQSAIMTKYVDLLVAPDTGLLHAAGCFSTHKMGLLTHTTIENITKHFENDHSIESLSPCAPCFRLITDADHECPVEKETRSCICMGREGMPAGRVLEKIREVVCCFRESRAQLAVSK